MSVDIRHQSWGGGGVYTAHDPDTAAQVGQLSYMESLIAPLLQITVFDISEAYRRRRVGTTLLEHMHADYPDHLISAGWRNAAGDGLYQFLKATHPVFPGSIDPGCADLLTEGVHSG